MNGKCCQGIGAPVHTSKEVEWRDEENTFSACRAIKTNCWHCTQNVPTSSRRKAATKPLSFVNSGLQDFSISRVNLEWGLPMPVDPSHSIYVWFDALLGYVTALLDPDSDPMLENALSEAVAG